MTVLTNKTVGLRDLPQKFQHDKLSLRLFPKKVWHWSTRLIACNTTAMSFWLRVEIIDQCWGRLRIDSEAIEK